MARSTIFGTASQSLPLRLVQWDTLWLQKCYVSQPGIIMCTVTRPRLDLVWLKQNSEVSTALQNGKQIGRPSHQRKDSLVGRSSGEIIVQTLTGSYLLRSETWYFLQGNTANEFMSCRLVTPVFFNGYKLHESQLIS